METGQALAIPVHLAMAVVAEAREEEVVPLMVDQVVMVMAEVAVAMGIVTRRIAVSGVLRAVTLRPRCLQITVKLVLLHMVTASYISTLLRRARKSKASGPSPRMERYRSSSKR